MEFEPLTEQTYFPAATDEDILHLSTATGDYNASVGDFMGASLRAIRDLAGEGIVKKTITGYESELVANQPRYFPRRQAIQSALCDQEGKTAFLQASGFDISLLASDFAPFLASMADGNTEATVSFTSDQNNVWTVGEGTSYLWIAKDKDSGAIAFETTSSPPRYDWKDKEPLVWATTNAFAGGTASASSFAPPYDSSQPWGKPTAGTNSWVPATHGTNPLGEWLQYDFGEGITKVIRLLRVGISASNPFPAIAIKVSNDETNWQEIARIIPGSHSGLDQGVQEWYPYFYIPEYPPSRYFRLEIVSTSTILAGIRGLLGYEAAYSEGDRHFSIRDKKWQVYTSGAWAEPDAHWICVGEVVADVTGVQEIYPYTLRGYSKAYLRIKQRNVDEFVNHCLGYPPRLCYKRDRGEWNWRNLTTPNVRGTAPGFDEWGEPKWMRGHSGSAYGGAESPSPRSYGSNIRRADHRSVVFRIAATYATLIPNLSNDNWGSEFGEYEVFFDRGW